MTVYARNFFVTSDTHFNHTNIIKYSNRPFKSVSEMNDKIINNWNKVVGENDIVFHLGDFCFGEELEWINLLNRLNGKIILIKGNHDKVDFDKLSSYLEGIYDYLEVRVPDSDASNGYQQIVLCHYAMRVWNKSHRGSWMLWGHSHGSLPDDPNALSFDVGVDCHNFKPLNYKEVKNIMKTKTFLPIDHHGK